MANAYATIANGGVHHDMFMVKKVSRASDNRVLYRAPKKTDRVLSEDLSADVSYALQQVVLSGTGQNAQALGRPAAGKTGTATNADGDVSSSWFVGYTPQVATAVMYVRGKGNEALNGFLPSYFGANYPTYTWRAVMQAVLEGTEPEDFPPAAFVDGEAPDDGHAPYTPPPEPTKKAKPKPNKPAAAQAHAGHPDPAGPADPAGQRRRQRRRRWRRRRRRHRPGQPPRDVRAHGPHLHPVTRTTGATDRDAVVAPTRTDPFARSMSEVVGGPVGRHARPHRWWVPVRVLLALFAVVFALSVVQHQPCLKTHWANDAGALRQGLLLRHPLPVHRPRARRGAVALRRHRRPLPGDGVPRRHLLPRLDRREGHPARPAGSAGRRAAPRGAGLDLRRCPAWSTRSTPTSW